MPTSRNAAIAATGSVASLPAPSGSLIPGVQVPPLAFEVCWYALVFYALMARPLGLSIGFVGAAGLAALTFACVIFMARRILVVALPLAYPLAFVGTYLGVQFLLGESLLEDDMRQMVVWTFGIVAVQCFALRRGFLHRFALFAFFIALVTMPFLGAYRGSATRIGVDNGISIGNPNDLAAWFGFCALYFAIVAFETRRQLIRILASGAFIINLFVMALTVSRGPLFALGLAGLVLFRRVLKRGFFALIPLVLLAWLAYGFGAFDRSVGLYENRGMEETGRFLVWPLAIGRILHDPLTGVGVSKVGTYVPEKTIEVSPHNQFLFVALAAGIVPFMFFLMHWVHSGRIVLQLERCRDEDAVFLVPMFTYVILIGMQLNQPYMSSWAVALLAVVGAKGFALKVRDAADARARPAPGAPLVRPAFSSSRIR